MGSNNQEHSRFSALEQFFKSRYISLILIILGLGAILVGIYRQEVAIVLTKATMICLECIGLG